MLEEPKVKSLFKALTLLDCFTPEHPERGIKELAEAAGMLKSSVCNVMQTFVLCGVAEKVGNGRYRLGNKILALANVLMANNEAHKRIKPFMDALAEKCNETVYYAIPSGIEVIYIESANPKSMPFVRNVVGIKAEMYCTGIGKAMLAYMGEELLERVGAAGLKAYTPYTITNAVALRSDMEETRRRGYAVDNMEHEYGIRCVGVPLRNRGGEVVGGMSISGPSLRIMDDKLLHFAERLQKAAAEIRELLV